MLSWFRPRPTFQDLTALWLADAERRCRPSYVREARRIIDRHLTSLARQRTDRISRQQISETIGGIASDAVANFAHAVVSSTFSWAIATGRLDGTNPATGLRKRSVPPREHVPSIDELVAIWRAGEHLGQFGQLVRLIIATGLRRAEAGGLLWAEVGSDKLTIGCERMKAKRAHTVPLTDLARSCLPERRDRAHVFGNRHATGFSGWSKGKAELDTRLQGVAPFRLHDIRRGVACGMAELGVSDSVIERVLAHTPAGVTRKHYNFSLREAEQRNALEAWAQHLRRYAA